jgi:hypothetical protein
MKGEGREGGRWVRGGREEGRGPWGHHGHPTGHRGGRGGGGEGMAGGGRRGEGKGRKGGWGEGL